MDAALPQPGYWLFLKLSILQRIPAGQEKSTFLNVFQSAGPATLAIGKFHSIQ
jgi:hypothetical protein